MELTQGQLQELLDYNSETGVFVWKKTVARSVKVGSIAGILNSHGYRCITIKGQQYKAHRLAWFYVNGVMPIMVDHIDGNKDNNSFKNLRETTTRHNGGNRVEHRNGKSVGQHLHKPTGKYRAQIEFNGKMFHLGLFTTPQEATEAYYKAVENIQNNKFTHKQLEKEKAPE